MHCNVKNRWLKIDVARMASGQPDVVPVSAIDRWRGKRPLDDASSEDSCTPTPDWPFLCSSASSEKADQPKLRIWRGAFKVQRYMIVS